MDEFDTKKWLLEDMGFSAEEADAMLPKFAERSGKLAKGYSRQSDYSKNMDDVKAAKLKLSEENDRLTAEMAEWAQLKENEKHESGDLRASIEQGQDRILKLEQKLTRLATDAGIDPKTVLGDVNTEPVVKPAPAAFDPKDLEANINSRIGGVAKYMMSLTAKLPRIQREHRELTGEDLDVDAFISGIEADLAKNKTDNLDPVKRWETQYQIEPKRTEKSAAQRKQELDAAREEGRIAARSEAMLPNTRPAGSGSPAFRAVGGASKLQRPQPADRLSGARAALASGKYHNAGPGGTMP